MQDIYCEAESIIIIIIIIIIIKKLRYSATGRGGPRGSG